MVLCSSSDKPHREGGVGSRGERAEGGGGSEEWEKQGIVWDRCAGLEEAEVFHTPTREGASHRFGGIATPGKRESG